MTLSYLYFLRPLPLFPNPPARRTHVSLSSQKIMAPSGLSLACQIRKWSTKTQDQVSSPCSSSAVAWPVATGFEVGVLIAILVALWGLEEHPLFLETYRKNQDLKKPTWILRLRMAVAHSFRPGRLISGQWPYLLLLYCLLRLGHLNRLLFQAESKAEAP